MASSPISAPVPLAPASSVAGGDISAERRLGRYAGVAALGSVVTMVGALFVAARAVGVRARLGDVPRHSTWLADLHAHAGAQEFAVLLRCASLLLAAAGGVYLYRVVCTRRGLERPLILWLGIAGPLLVAAVTAVGYLVIAHVADTFMAGAHTEARADHLIRASSSLRVVRFFEFASRLPFGIWVVLISFDALRVGALTRMVGYWGVAAGTAVALQFTPGDALLAGWIGSLGILFLGYWPGGRPETWETGRPSVPSL